MFLPRRLQQVIPRVRRLRHLISGPGEIGIVGIGIQTEGLRGLPRPTQIDATLILNLSAIAETLGVERGVGIGIESLQKHQTRDIAEAQTHGVDSGQMPFAVCGRLAAERPSGCGITIVEAQVQEVAALGIMPTIEGRSVGLQRPVEMGEERVYPQTQTMGIVAQTATRLQQMEVMFLPHLHLRTMVVGIEDRRDGAVLVQRRIGRTVRGEGRQFQIPAQVDG